MLKKQSGFTLVEMVLTVLLLSVGLVTVMRGLIVVNEAINKAAVRMEAGHLLDRAFQYELAETKVPDLEMDQVDEVVGKNGEYVLNKSWATLSAELSLYRLTYNITWMMRSMPNTLSRERDCFEDILNLVEI